MKLSPKIIGFLQASGLTLYVSLLAYVFQHIKIWFPDGTVSPMLAMILFLLVFVISALISGSLILGYPILSFVSGKRDGAVKIVIWSAVWIFVYLVVIGTISATLKQ